MCKFVINLMFAGASLLGTGAIVAYADPAVAAAPTVTVHYTADELASVDGRAAIAKRLRAAATRVCPTRGVGDFFATQTCRTEAYAQAKQTLGEVAATQTDHTVQLAAR
jgi:UrcA family protein